MTCSFVSSTRSGLTNTPVAGASLANPFVTGLCLTPIPWSAMASAQFGDCSARWHKTPGRRLAHHRVVAELPNLVFVTLVAVLQVGLCVLTKCARARCVGAPRTEPDLPADSQTKMLPP